MVLIVHLKQVQRVAAPVAIGAMTVKAIPLPHKKSAPLYHNE
jgi:hypothetical protein